MKTTITEIAKKAGISQPMLSMILNGYRRPSWTVAKRLATVTGIVPELWMEADADELSKLVKADNGSK